MRLGNMADRASRCKLDCTGDSPLEVDLYLGRTLFDGAGSSGKGSQTVSG